MFKKLLFPLLTLALIVPISQKTNSVSAEAVVIENGGDAFYESDTSFTANESFVYTSVATFENGQACGVVIGGERNNHYWVFNIDRYENHTKLLYFDYPSGNLRAREVRNEYFIGNDKTTQSEFNVINPKLRDCREYNFKVVVTVEEGHAYAEFFLDNIKRFGVDSKIDLNNVLDGVTYQGGKLGFNVFNARVSFDQVNVGHSDYAYYTEPYRNQYHYSQYAHWNNDPNGLVYYDGWYHMFYQTHPFSQYWDHMYWGHARSRDLVHWQELPIALFPDDGTMGKGLGVGYAWSGIAMVYRPGMSSYIDGLNWFPNGSGTGLLGYYTRDGERQDQIIISSDDGGLTWTKRELISQHLIYDAGKIDCRDPSIFPVVKDGSGKVTMWGMILSGANTDKYWFLKSEDLFHWSYAGQRYLTYPECMTVSKMTADDGQEHSVITVASRSYTVGDFSLNYVTGEIEFTLTDGREIETVHQNEAFRPMEYGEDSYAAQCFYIDDDTSKYYGKSISVSWFSGLPSDAESGAYAQVRKPWNGGGMTIPVELGLRKVDNAYVLTQTPITLNNTDLDKTQLVNKTNLTYNNQNDPMSAVNSHLFELQANIQNDNEESVEFRVNVSSDEYTAFGWNKTDGYYFDRTHTNRAGINFVKNYSHKFVTGPVDGHNLSFYVLVDNGGLELFCDNFRYAFYNLTLAAPYSLGASLTTSGEVKVTSLKVHEIASTWYDINSLDKGILYLDKENIDLDLTLNDEEEIIAYSSINSEINFEITSGDDVVSLTKTSRGATVKALKNGSAEIKITSDDNVKTVSVTVNNGEINCDYELSKDDVYSGKWLTTPQGLVARQNNGDGFIISDTVGGDFTYSALFNIENAAAAGLLIRASKDMSSYIMANYDKNAHSCKIWSPNGLIASSNVSGDVDNKNVMLTVKTIDRDIELYINGTLTTVGRIKESDPLSGYYGLNVFAGEAIFKNISVLKSDYDYENKDVVIDLDVHQYIKNIYNVTDKNTLVDRSYYHVEEDKLIIHNAYIQLLNENTIYSFFIEGDLSSFLIKVNVGSITRSLVIEDYVINEGESINVFMGAFSLETITINGASVDNTKYQQNGRVLHIDSSCFKLGENTVVINGVSFTVTVNSVLESVPQTKTSTLNELWNEHKDVIIPVVSIATPISIIAAVLLALSTKKGKKIHE